MRSVYRPQHLWIDRQVLDSPVTANVMQALADVPCDIVDGLPPVNPPASQAARMTFAKKHLYLTAQKGRFVRDCPGASSHNTANQLCCGYMIVDLIYNCDYDCTYCYLQQYVNAPYLTVYANIDRLFDEISTFLRARPHQLVRIGSGEFSDSLSLDPLTGFSQFLIPFLRQFPNVLFEFKTKSDLVDNLLAFDPQGRVMVSWSLNPQAVIQREEHKTASLEARLQAARRCQEAGYKIGLHFDPLLYFPGWEALYRPFVAEVFQLLSPNDITYISMGSLRFAPELKAVVQERFPRTRLMSAELVPGADGKMRYFRPLRTEMYRHMLQWLRPYMTGFPVYLCMEPHSVWQRLFPQTPACNQDMEQYIQTAERRPSSAAVTWLETMHSV